VIFLFISFGHYMFRSLRPSSDDTYHYDKSSIVLRLRWFFYFIVILCMLYNISLFLLTESSFKLFYFTF
jgi:hypothetical protein